MTFVEDIDFLTNYSASLIRQRKINYSPQDLVNEAYIHFHNKAGVYIRRDAILFLVGLSYDLAEIKHSTNTFHDDGKALQGKEHAGGVFQCKRCLEILPDSLFRRMKVKGTTYPRSECRMCEAKNFYKWAKANKDKMYLHIKAWREKNRDHINKYQNEWYHANKDRVREKRNAYRREYYKRTGR